jgi:hypothetical protein
LEILDACVTYGRSATPKGKPYLSPGELLAEMDRLGIAEAWCADWRALENAPSAGNRLLCEEIADSPRLHPVWTVLPPGTAETPSPGELLSAMGDAGVSMVRAEPNRHGYVLAEWCCAELWDALEGARVPLLLVTEDPRGLKEMLDAHPRLPVLLTAIGYRADRWLYPLLSRHANLYVETSTYLVNEGLRTVAERFGAGRLVFGTNSPVVCPEEGLGTLQFSGLGPEQKALVAGRTLRGLLAAAEGHLAEAAP